MINRSSIRDFGDHAVWAGILLITASLPLSKFGMSLGQFIIAGGWLLGGSIGAKFAKAFRQPVVWVLWGIYFLHLLGLWNTVNFDYALTDLRIKIPMFLMPLFFSSMNPLTAKQYRTVLIVLIAATLTSSLISVCIYLNIIHRTVNDIRDISIFISHIRLALMVCISITSCLWFIRNSTSRNVKPLFIATIIWFIGFLILLESLTGLFILVGGTVLFLFTRIIRPGTATHLRVVFSIIVLGTLFTGVKLYQYVFIDSIKIITVDPKSLPLKTPLGGTYVHDLTRQDLENGNLVFLYVCESEMDSAWNTKSKLSMYGPNNKGHLLRMTLSRYLTAKGYTKDGTGVNKLSLQEIKDIENGIANPNDEQLSNLESRIGRLAWENRQYYFTRNPSGHSVTQRLEFWKAARHIITQHPWQGVGTGDVKGAFSDAYDEMDSKLDEKYRLRSHNQYLSIGVAFGLPGLMYFIFALIFPWLAMQKRRDFIYSAFLFIAVCSMLSEDTLETQAGVTFFAFLSAFLLFNDSRRGNAKIS